MAKTKPEDETNPPPAPPTPPEAAPTPKRKVVARTAITVEQQKFWPGDDVSHLEEGTLESMLRCKDAAVVD